MAYKPQLPFTVPMILLIPTYSTVNGVRKKTFPAVADGFLFNGTFKTYGGTEKIVNDVYSIEDTAQVETWFRPDISSGCRIALANNPSAVYEIISEPENIDMRCQYLVFKVSRIKGGA